MRRGALAAAAARVEDFFLEPAAPRDLEPGGAVASGERGSPPSCLKVAERPQGRTVEQELAREAAPAPPAPRTRTQPVFAVFGLGRGCGATVVARALAAELAARDAVGAAAVVSGSRVGGMPLATPAARRLAAALADVPRAVTAAVGRLCLVDQADPLALADSTRSLAPLVIDAGNAEIGGPAAASAGRVLLVTGPGIEPALTAAAAECVRGLGVEPLTVSNRSRPQAAGGTGGDIELPDSRMGAQLALGGRQARGELGVAVARLADLCEVGR